MFPMVDPGYVREQLQLCGCGQGSHLECVTNLLLDNNSYPRKAKVAPPAATAEGREAAGDVATASTSVRSVLPAVSVILLRFALKLCMIDCFHHVR